MIYFEYLTMPDPKREGVTAHVFVFTTADGTELSRSIIYEDASEVIDTDGTFSHENIAAHLQEALSLLRINDVILKVIKGTKPWTAADVYEIIKQRVEERD